MSVFKSYLRQLIRQLKALKKAEERMKKSGELLMNFSRMLRMV